MSLARQIVLLGLGLGLAAPLVRAASASNQTVLGRVFLVSNPESGDVTKRRVRVVAREPSGAATIVGNPTVNGANLFVVANDANLPPESGYYFNLPAAGWSAKMGGYVYRDSDGVYGAVRVARIEDTGAVFRVRASLGPRAPFTIPVVPPAPGVDGGATLTINAGDSYCMRFGGAAGGKVYNSPASTGEKLFKVTRPSVETGCVQCSDQGGGMCGGACGIQQFCYPGAQCQCVFIFGTTTFTTTSTSSTTFTTTTTSTSCPPPTALYCGVSGCAPLPALCPTGMSCQTVAEGCGCVGPAIPCGDASLSGLSGDFCRWGSCPAGTTCGRVAKPDACGFDCTCQ
jgi:hypothetical protein